MIKYSYKSTMPATICCLLRVNFHAIRNIIFAAIVFANDVYPLTLKTEDIGLHLHEETDLVLNCTYQKESSEEIGYRDIRWQKWIGNTFKDVAVFSPPGGQPPFIVREMESLYSKRTELIAPTDGSLRAILILNKLMCDDVGEYRCWVEYYSDEANYESTSFSTVAFKATMPIMFWVYPNEIEEHRSLILSCGADVGAPKGSIKIWKLTTDSKSAILLFKSNKSSYKTEDCSEFINATFTYTVSRDDNGALFQCSSQNILNTVAEPMLESRRISVSYGPDDPVIILNPNKSSFSIGEDISLHCNANCNPLPNITWMFQYREHSKGMTILTSIKGAASTLTLKNIQMEVSGNYTCFVKNAIGESYNVVLINVSERVKSKQTRIFLCDGCWVFENCKRTSDKAIFVTNIWMFTGIVFIILSVVFVIAIVFQIKHRNSTQEKQSTITISLYSHSLGCPFQPSDSGDSSSADAIHPTDSLYHVSCPRRSNPGSTSGSSPLGDRKLIQIKE